MSLVSPTQSNPGDEITAAAINTPVNQLAAVVNGQIDDDNVSSISGSKISAGTISYDRLAEPIAFYATTTQSIPDNTVTEVATYTEVFDYGTAFASGVFTAPYTGVYQFNVNTGILNMAADSRIQTDIKKNGTIVASSFGISRASTHDPTANISICINLAATDTVNIQVYHQGTSAAQNLVSSSFGGYLVGRTS